MGLLNHTFSVIKQTPYSRLKKYKQIPLLVGLAFIFTIGTARSYDNDYGSTFDMSEIVSHETLKTKLTVPSSTTGLCTSLLNTHTHKSSKFPVVRTQRSVGKAAALGLLLGVRFALEPKQNHNANVTTVDAPLMHQVKVEVKPTKQSVKNVVAYRSCLKDQALSRIASAK